MSAMKCERCEHAVAPDSPVWCQDCHDEQIEMLEAECDVWSGRACREEVAAGNGVCGACRNCLPILLNNATGLAQDEEDKARIWKATAELAQDEARSWKATAEQAEAENVKLRDFVSRVIGDDGPDLDAYLDRHTKVTTGQARQLRALLKESK